MGIKVFAPATIANLAVGFDVLGVALDGPGDDVIIRKTDKKGLRISAIRRGDKLPTDIMKNTAGYAAYKLLEHLGELDCPLEMEIHKNMPFGSGMGSSAASAVAGVMAVNEILGNPLQKRELLPFAAMGEQLASGTLHLDNVAPSLIGGIVLTRDAATMDVVRIFPPKGIYFIVIHPDIQILTEQSRSQLSLHVTLSDAVKQTASIGAFIAGCYTSNIDLITRSMQDHLIESQRFDTIPHYQEMKEIALSENAMGFNISGSGPAMFAMCRNSFIAESIQERALALYQKYKIDVNCYISPINHEGAWKY